MMKKIIETVAEGGGELGVHMYPYLSVCVTVGKVLLGFFFPLFEKFSPSYVEILVGVFVWKMLHCDSFGLLQLLNTCPCVNQFALLCHKASEQYVLLGSSLPTAFVCSGGNG